MINRSLGTGLILRIIRDAGLAVSLVRDYWHGSYRAIPCYSLLAIVVALLYLISPLDCLPDILPIIGLVDDALVLVVCLSLVEKDLRSYGEWKERLERKN